jgi:hypothetical protein
MDGVSQGGNPRSPRIPELPGRPRSGPVPALRAIFASIGRIVLAAERPAEVPKDPAAPPTASRWRSLDLTGNVRLLSPEDLTEAAAPEAPVPAENSQNGVRELPIDGYDALSLASIRARLRGLDLGQVRVLAGYERTHAERPDVMGMLERRIAKLEGGG